MTDRMSNVEIEDVLSSIRKLVSDDLRPSTTMSSVATVPAKPDVPRLVLTPALRVPPRALAPGPDVDNVRAEAVPPEPASPAAAVDDDGLASRLADLEALIAGQGHSFDDQQFEDESLSPVLLRHPMAPSFAADDGTEAPYLSDDDGPVADSFAWADAAPAPEGEARPGLQDDPASVSDEAALRDLIRDVLREELQGAMGERVTRNLRKLVRAEIVRALTARGIA